MILGWIRRRRIKRDALKKIEAYRQVPELLDQMDAHMKKRSELVAQALAAMPPEELKKRQVALARKIVSLMAPETVPIIEAEFAEVDKDEAYVYAMGRLVAILEGEARDMIGELRGGINEDCKAGIDSQLDVLRGLKNRREAQRGV